MLDCRDVTLLDAGRIWTWRLMTLFGDRCHLLVTLLESESLDRFLVKRAGLPRRPKPLGI